MHNFLTQGAGLDGHVICYASQLVYMGRAWPRDINNNRGVNLSTISKPCLLYTSDAADDW